MLGFLSRSRGGSGGHAAVASEPFVLTSLAVARRSRLRSSCSLRSRFARPPPPYLLLCLSLVDVDAVVEHVVDIFDPILCVSDPVVE